MWQNVAAGSSSCVLGYWAGREFIDISLAASTPHRGDIIVLYGARIATRSRPATFVLCGALDQSGASAITRPRRAVVSPEDGLPHAPPEFTGRVPRDHLKRITLPRTPRPVRGAAPQGIRPALAQRCRSLAASAAGGRVRGTGWAGLISAGGRTRARLVPGRGGIAASVFASPVRKICAVFWVAPSSHRTRLTLSDLRVACETSS